MQTLAAYRRYAFRAMSFGALAIIVTLACGTLAELLWRRHVAQRYHVRGTLVTVGDRVVQLDCRGEGSPVVVFESGLDNLGSLSWTAVHDDIARVTRACAYSRAGLLWSAAAPGAFAVERVATDLHRALQASGEHPPFVMVGHSLGGPYVLDYTARFPREVRGIVLVDASHPNQQTRIARATGLPMSAMQPPSLLLRAGAFLSRTGLIHLLSLPEAPPSWPPSARTVPSAFLSQSMATVRDEGLSVGTTFARADSVRDVGDRPMVVLTAGRAVADSELSELGMTRVQATRKQREWTAMQREMATWSRQGRQEQVSDASHYIQFDRPDVVIRAIIEVVAQVRSTAAHVARAGTVRAPLRDSMSPRR